MRAILTHESSMPFERQAIVTAKLFKYTFNKETEKQSRNFPPLMRGPRVLLEGSGVIPLLSQQHTSIIWWAHILQQMCPQCHLLWGPSHSEKHKPTNAGLRKLQEANSVKDKQGRWSRLGTYVWDLHEMAWLTVFVTEVEVCHHFSEHHCTIHNLTNRSTAYIELMESLFHKIF